MSVSKDKTEDKATKSDTPSANKMRLEPEKQYRLRGDLCVGGIVKAQKREYRLARIEAYTTKAGKASKLLTWQGTCVQCGGPYEFHTGRGRFNPYANCPQHRPGAKS